MRSGLIVLRTGRPHAITMSYFLLSKIVSEALVLREARARWKMMHRDDQERHEITARAQSKSFQRRQYYLDLISHCFNFVVMDFDHQKGFLRGDKSGPGQISGPS